MSSKFGIAFGCGISMIVIMMKCTHNSFPLLSFACSSVVTNAKRNSKNCTRLFLLPLQMKVERPTDGMKKMTVTRQPTLERIMPKHQIQPSPLHPLGRTKMNSLRIASCIMSISQPTKNIRVDPPTCFISCCP